MYRFLLITYLILFSSFLKGQQVNTISKVEIDAFINAIMTKSSEMTTFEADFTEQKSVSVLRDVVTSQGKMFFKREDNIRWEYVKPQQIVLVTTSEGELLISNGTRITDPNALRGFREVSDMIKGFIDGSVLNDSNRFDISYSYGDDGLFVITMIPKNRRLRQFINEMDLSFKDGVIHSFLMRQTGDSTLINFNNIRINGTIDQSVFKTDYDDK